MSDKLQPLSNKAFLLRLFSTSDVCQRGTGDHREMKAIPHKLKEDVCFPSFPFIGINFILFQQKTDKNSDSFRMLVALLRGYSLGHCKLIRRTQESIYGKRWGNIATIVLLCRVRTHTHTHTQIIF